MLIDVVLALRNAGLSVRNFRDERLEINNRVDSLLEVGDETGGWIFAVEEKHRTPYPNEVTALEARRVSLRSHGEPLLVAPFITEGTGEALAKAGWSWADSEGNFRLRAPGLMAHQRRPRTRQTRPKTIPQGNGGLGIIRALIGFEEGLAEPRDATGLANQAQVTQPRASQVLGRLQELGLVRKDDGYWWPNREALLDRFLSEYRGPGGSEHYFYSLAEPGEVAVAVTKDSSFPHPTLVSADVGPDLYAPWLRPRVVVLYTRAEDQPENVGLVEASGRSDANVIIRHPNDLSVFTHNTLGRLDGSDIPIVDAAQLIWDLQDLGGADRFEAAGELRKWLLNH